MQPSPYTIQSFSRLSLFEALSNPYCNLPGVERHQVANNLFVYLDQIAARTIVIENDYIDHDYLDDFASYYVRCFQPYDRRCKRLHFFSIPLSEETFLQMVCGQLSASEVDRICAAYLGFIVARPLPEAIIGRTALVTYKGGVEPKYFPCSVSYRANLFGIRLKVEGLAFQEQDTVLAACATVALWCSFSGTRKLFGSPAPTPAEITRIANQVVQHTRPIPSHGLNVQQICTAIKSIGLEPEVLHVNKNTPLRSLLYSYLKLGLPVVLGVSIEGRGGHAITLTGYDLSQNLGGAPSAVNVSKDAPLMVGRRISEFYAHDDQIGPYASIQIKATDAAMQINSPNYFEGGWKDSKTGAPLKLVPTVIIIPVYNKVRVTFIDVQQWIARLHSVVLQALDANQNLEWDIYLTTTNKYKKQIKNRLSANPEYLQRQRLKQHPKYIWCAELTVNGQLVLEVLSDATDMQRSMSVYDVFWHNTQLKSEMQGLLASEAAQAALIDVLTKPFLAFLLTSTQS